MDTQNIAERVFKIVSEQLGYELDKLTEDTSFIQDLGSDSLDLVELTMELEEEFQISIPEEAADDIQTIGDVIRRIEMEVNKEN
ncbi:MAG: acyl carrier protein [Thermoguttaceae bacterium]|nr:acyl carrier protein [Thermoguttaceae bacterium]MBQ9456197.1 acyl carrier protein [Thermoguttaceae bacterium]MDO4856890.1 acyl carrier protein [Thermoguttaceae bacterium]